jgi:hypothetical protein
MDAVNHRYFYASIPMVNLISKEMAYDLPDYCMYVQQKGERHEQKTKSEPANPGANDGA